MPPDERGARLAHLGELDDYAIVAGQPDVRGWKVRSADGQAVGKVEDLIVDLDARKVLWLEVALDRAALDLPDDRNVLVPIEHATLHGDARVVALSERAVDLTGLSPFARDVPRDERRAPPP